MVVCSHLSVMALQGQVICLQQAVNKLNWLVLTGDKGVKEVCVRLGTFPCIDVSLRSSQIIYILWTSLGWN